MEIRNYRPGDESGFLKLDHLTEFHPWNRRDIDNWKWKFTGNNPAGKPIMVYAENEAEIIGHFAAIPIRYWIDGASVTASHSVAMMIDPRWQNRGLIKFVADRVIQQLEEQEIPFTYGYPNDNAYELHIRLLGYQEVAQQKMYYKELTSDVRKLTDQSDSSFIWKKIERFNGIVNDLWEKSKNSYPVIVERTARFLNWRYLDRPDVSYEAFGAFVGESLEGYCVLKLYQEKNILRGHFIDLFTSSENRNCASFLIKQGLSFFNEKEADEVTLWIQGCPFMRDVLKEQGFSEGGISGGGWPGSTRPMVCRFNHEKQFFQRLLIGEHWYFTMGDTLEIY